MLNPLPKDDLLAIVTDIGTGWENLKHSNIFLTGGTGFFGRWLTESFLLANTLHNLNSRLTILTRDARSFLREATHLHQNPNLDFIEGDIQDFSFPSGKFSHIIHAAANIDTQNADDAYASLISTINGANRIFDFAKKAKSERFLFTSSGAYYGARSTLSAPPCETDCTAPDTTCVTSVYGEGKRVTELLGTLHANASGFDFLIARCFAFVGPGIPLSGKFAIGNFIRDASRGLPPSYRGSGESIRSYLYMSDLTTWLWHILFRGKSLHPYNVGSPEKISIFELAHVVSATLNAPAPISDGNPDSKSVYFPSISRIQSELKLQPRVSLETSILKTYHWLKSQ